MIESTDKIVLNAVDLNLELAQVRSETIFPQIVSKNIKISAADRTATLKFDAPIAKGVHTLDIVFNGSLSCGDTLLLSIVVICAFNFQGR